MAKVSASSTDKAADGTDNGTPAARSLRKDASCYRSSVLSGRRHAAGHHKIRDLSTAVRSRLPVVAA
jgi:hypothetical protein